MNLIVVYIMFMYAGFSMHEPRHVAFYWQWLYVSKSLMTHTAGTTDNTKSTVLIYKHTAAGTKVKHIHYLFS